MSIEKDHVERRNRNKKFLEKFLLEYFENSYSKFSTYYNNKINSELIDPESPQELKKFVTTEYQRLNESKPRFFETNFMHFQNIKIENEIFIYSLSEIIQKAGPVINEIHPLLENKKDGQSASFQYFMGSVMISAEKAYLKSIVGKTSSIYNSTIFSNPEVQEFFELFLYKNWLIDIAECRPQLSYIYKRLKKSGNYNDNNDPGEIICTGKKFLEYWNAKDHPFKIELKEKSNTSLHNSPGYSHCIKFDALLLEYRGKII